MCVKYGYARVSSSSQNLARQVAELKKYGLTIFEDKSSGKDFNRPFWKQLESNLKKGDELYITSLDRLARDKDLIKNKLVELKDKGIVLRILDIPTTLEDFPKDMESIQDMIYNILIEILSTMAQKERESIRVRQAQGIAQAKESGKAFQPKVSKAEFNKAYQLYYTREIKTKKALAEYLNISRVTLDRMVKVHITDESKKADGEELA